MKKSIFLVLLAFVIFTNFSIAQDLKPEKEYQNTIDAIEQTIDFYIQQNIDKKIPIDFSNAARTSSELNDVKSRNYYIRSLKEDFLRKEFFDNNPSLKTAYRKGKNDVTPCTDDNDDGTFENGNPGTYSATKNGSPTPIVTESPFVDPLSPVAIVSSGNDPILFSLTTGLQDANAITLSRTNGSTKAVRINQNKRFFTNMTDNAENDKLLKTFVADDRYITLDYAAVLEKWSQHSVAEHPYFKVNVYVDGSPFATDSETVRASDSDLESFDDFLDQNNVNDSYANLTNNLNTDLRYSGQWETMTLDIGEANVGKSVELRLEVRDCSQSVHAGYVYIDNISNCGDDDPDPCTNPCNINADIDINNVSACVREFSGTNLIAPQCEDIYSYTWTIKRNGVTITTNTNKDFTYDFSNDSDGYYIVELRVTYDDGSVKICQDKESVTIYINCQPDCKPASCLDIVEVENCVDYQAWMNCNDPNIDYINWYYTISSTYYHVFAGQSSGNAAGQHAQPIYLPSPPAGISSWDNYNLYVYAEIVFENGTVCDEVYTYITLDCDDNGGIGGNFRNSQNDLKLYPNPIKPNQELHFDGIDKNDIENIEVLDIVGNIKLRLKPTSNTLNVRNLTSGIYFVKFYTSKGIEQKKIVVK
ncbi:T9SS type A sorting domain-containing protein [uncultured Psychroserpens sp.]|uniref:T9SS type A sorting domain-containing protein n=1 Tax=uncultured Psychroserpens sp. TaxID=255436 RepID=UPI002604D482|nr:T9SS type A sorting domain-containing protein [uncultured Psychroserpens sp.]